MQIENLKLTTRAYNVLKRANVNTTEQLVQFSPDQILSMRCSNADVLQSVQDALKAAGLCLSPTPCSLPEQAESDDSEYVIRECFVERYPEPIQSQLKARSLCNKQGFANVTIAYIAAIPGMTPELLRDLAESLSLSGVHFADVEPNRKCFAERYPEPLQSVFKARGLFYLQDFATVTKSYVAAIPGVTPAVLQELEDTLELFDIKFAEQKTFL